ESAYAALTQKPEIHGPPMYFTQDWQSAENSVKALSELRPETVITGHGRALSGDVVPSALETLYRNFKEVALPEIEMNSSSSLAGKVRKESTKPARYSRGEIPVIAENISPETSGSRPAILPP